MLIIVFVYTLIHISVHFRIRVIDQHRPKSLTPSTSGITYWQIEAEHSILHGNWKIYQFKIIHKK